MLVPKELVAWWVKHHSLRLHVLFNRKNNNNNNNKNNWQGQIYPAAAPPQFCLRPRILTLSSLLELFPTFKAVNIIINMPPTAAAPTPSLPDGRAGHE